MKLALMRTATGKEDPELPLLQKILYQLPTLKLAAQINTSLSSSNRHINCSETVRRRHESGLHGWIAAKKPLLKDTNNKKRLAWAKKHKQWTLDRWQSVLWCDESKCNIFGSNRCAFVRRLAGKRMISACVVPTVNHEGGGVMVSGCFAGGQICSNLFRIQGTLNEHGYHSILQWMPSHLVCA
jgi:hypothetical protein